MEFPDKKEENMGSETQYKHTVHHVLAHSYVVYFVLLLLGIYLNIIFNFKIFPDSVMVPVGLFLLVLASSIIVWAQKTGRDLRKVEEVRAEHFHKGPYCYTRIPTQWGLFLLLLGLGIVINSFFVILATILAFLISKFIFVDKHEKILENNYGEAYREYKKLVKF